MCKAHRHHNDDPYPSNITRGPCPVSNVHKSFDIWAKKIVDFLWVSKNEKKRSKTKNHIINHLSLKHKKKYQTKKRKVRKMREKRRKKAALQRFCSNKSILFATLNYSMSWIFVTFFSLPRLICNWLGYNKWQFFKFTFGVCFSLSVSLCTQKCLIPKQYFTIAAGTMLCSFLFTSTSAQIHKKYNIDSSKQQ